MNVLVGREAMIIVIYLVFKIIKRFMEKKIIGIGEKMIAKSKSHVKLRLCGLEMPSGVFPMSQSNVGHPFRKGH